MNIQVINSDEVFLNNKILFNTNNHYIADRNPQPIDYNDRLRATMTCNWIHKFHQTYHTIVLDPKEITWIKRAFEQGSITGHWPQDYDDELEALCAKYSFPEGNWFVRTEYVSLKGGYYGVGPYDNVRDIIISMVTTTERHCCVRPDDTSCTIYLMPWQTIDPDREFRVFVYQNTITAISVQDIFHRNEWLCSLSQNDIRGVVQLIMDYFEITIKERLSYIADYTFDFALLNDTPYFIEPNSFGRNYAAGSALFHWVTDHDILHDTHHVVLRYTE